MSHAAGGADLVKQAWWFDCADVAHPPPQVVLTPVLYHWRRTAANEWARLAGFGEGWEVVVIKKGLADPLPQVVLTPVIAGFAAKVVFVSVRAAD